MNKKFPLLALFPLLVVMLMLSAVVPVLGYSYYEYHYVTAGEIGMSAFYYYGSGWQEKWPSGRCGWYLNTWSSGVALFVGGKFTISTSATTLRVHIQDSGYYGNLATYPTIRWYWNWPLNTYSDQPFNYNEWVTMEIPRKGYQSGWIQAQQFEIWMEYRGNTLWWTASDGFDFMEYELLTP